MSNDFLPPDYEVPRKPSTADRYSSFEEGDNRFRILSKPILGYSWWEYADDTGGIKLGSDRNPAKRPIKPFRVKTKKEIPDYVPAGEEKHFWAMVVWNYQTSQIEILEITQPSIQDKIRGHAADPDWGKPFTYDIVIEKTGRGLDTRYPNVRTKPKAPRAAQIDEAAKEIEIDLDQLYAGENPFIRLPDAEPVQEEPKSEKVEDIDIDDIPF